jgi:hypothetical protein
MRNKKMLILAAVCGSFLLWLAAASPARATCTNPPGGEVPPNMQIDLYAVLQGNLPTNGNEFMSSLDTDFCNWTDYHSQNEPVLAAAIALIWAPHGTAANGTRVVDFNGQLFDAVSWWYTFLECQVGDACPTQFQSSTYLPLRQLKGTEVLSNGYDMYPTIAAVAAFYWGTVNNDSRMTSDAGAYLQLTWILYSLGASAAPATHYGYYTATSSSNATLLWNSGTCNSGYTGPYMALAGARSIPFHSCESDRGALFAAAIGWSDKNQTQFTNESMQQQNLRVELQNLWGPPASRPFGNTVYAITPSTGANLQGFLGRPGQPVQEGDGPTLSLFIRKLAGVAFSEELHFIGWHGALSSNQGGARLSTMGSSPNIGNDNTSGLYANLYTPGSNGAPNSATLLYPWLNARTDLSHGSCSLNSNTNPTSATATNWSTTATPVPDPSPVPGLPKTNPVITVTLGAPGSGYMWHLKLNSTGTVTQY